jgi:hypothetical protein
VFLLASLFLIFVLFCSIQPRAPRAHRSKVTPEIVETSPPSTGNASSATAMDVDIEPVILSIPELANLIDQFLWLQGCGSDFVLAETQTEPGVSSESSDTSSNSSKKRRSSTSHTEPSAKVTFVFPGFENF